MNVIKMKTTASHRFGRVVTLKKDQVTIAKDGTCEVPEKVVAYALTVGFTLIDPNQKFTSVEEQQRIEETTSIIENAKLQAQEIIQKAKEQAEEIIKQAKIEAGAVAVDNSVVEKTEYKTKLSAHKKEELVQICLDSGIDPAEINGKTKEQLVEMMIGVAFGT